MKYHPDRNPGDKQAEEKFKKIKSLRYFPMPKSGSCLRLSGHAGVDARWAAGPMPISATFSATFSAIFSAARDDAGGGTRSRAQRGADLRYNLDLTLEEAVSGTDVKIRVPTYVRAKPVANRGEKRQQPGDLFHLPRPWRGADTTRLLRRPAKPACLPWHGAANSKTHAKRVTAKPGARNQDSVRQESTRRGHRRPHQVGRGRRSRRVRRTPGDLYVQVNVKEHPIFHPDRRKPLLRSTIKLPHGLFRRRVGGTHTGRQGFAENPPETQTDKLLPPAAPRASSPCAEARSATSFAKSASKPRST